MKKYLLLFILTLLHVISYAQKEWSNWYSDPRQMLTFKNGYAQVVTNYITDIPPVPPFENLYHYYYMGEGGISYSDPVTGDMKFIISSRLGFSSNFDDFPNDTFVRSCPDAKSYHIIPFHNNPNKFYVLQFQSAAADLTAQETGLQVRCPNAVGLAYSLVDLSLNGGLGDFYSMNNVITQGLTEQIVTVRHANGRDVWVIVHPYMTAAYDAYLVTDAGIQPAVRSNIGVMISGGSASVYGTLTASHDGKLLAGARSGNGANSRDIELFDFDNATGEMSNYRRMPYRYYTSKLQFSPDNKKLYSLAHDTVAYNTVIHQWDFAQPNPAITAFNIGTRLQGNFYDMQLAPDGKIYVANYQETVNDVFHAYLMAIECPNLPKFACKLNRRALEITTPGFPPLINDFINQAAVAPPPQFSIGNDTAICFGSLTLTAPAGWQSYQWSTGDTTRSITVREKGTYYVLTGSVGFSCPEGYGYINVEDLATKLNLGKDTALCKGQTYLLHVPDGYTNILWSNGSTVRDSLITQAYCMISANDPNGCLTRDSISIYYKWAPNADFGSDTVLCNNEVLPLRLTPPKTPFFSADYLWSNGSTEDTLTVRQPGTFWGRVSFDGCTVSDTITVSYVTGEGFSLGNDTAICEGDSLLLHTSIAMANYLWSNGATTNSIQVHNPGFYWLQVSKNSCIVKDTIVVQQNLRPIVNLGRDTTLCDKQTLSLDASLSTGIYLWQDGTTQNNFTVQTAGLYWVKVSQAGCTGADSIRVTYQPLPPLRLGNDTGFCAGTQLILNAYSAAASSYLWQDMQTNATYTATQAGSYSVQVTGSNGCINSDTIVLSVLPLPIFSLGADTILCEGQRLQYNFTDPFFTYQWSSGSNSNSQTIASPGLYWLTVNNQGCSKRDSIVVLYKPLPGVQLGNDTTLCAGATLLLNATQPNAAYQWQDGTNAATMLVNKEGLYTVTVNLDGCTAKDSIHIAYTDRPLFTLGADTTICEGQTIFLSPSVTNPGVYRWQDGSNAPSLLVGDSGMIVLSISNTCGTQTAMKHISKGVCQLYIPTAFTPDNNSLNDWFRIKYPFPVRRFRMTVYNRYGQVVFASNNMQQAWDGNYKGQPQPTGNYIWLIDMTDQYGVQKVLKGNVMLVR